MTPKEHALEIYCKMLSSSSKIEYFEAKKCAMIAVDLLISVEDAVFEGIVYTSYWRKVKNQLKKL